MKLKKNPHAMEEYLSGSVDKKKSAKQIKSLESAKQRMSDNRPSEAED